MITAAQTNEERQEVLDLFLNVFDDIDPNAVPMTDMDPLYSPIVAQYRDPVTGRLLGAALTCRAQVAVGSLLLSRAGMSPPPEQDYTSVLDRHSELDLMAVLPEARGRGVGGQLLDYLEEELRQRGVRVWFGNVTDDLQVSLLRRFYSSHGFTVLEPGQPLPALLGKRWRLESAEVPVFHFYKQLVRHAG